ncbi:MAG: hypothetical protein AB1589_18885 [Cyanobacteriota bacterium]
MKFTGVFKTHKKVGFIGSIVLLLFFLSGCFNPLRFAPLSQSGYFQKCREAEKVVSQAEKEYDEAKQEIINGNQDKNTLQNFSEKRQKLQEAQEKALRECNPEN